MISSDLFNLSVAMTEAAISNDPKTMKIVLFAAAQQLQNDALRVGLMENIQNPLGRLEPSLSDADNVVDVRELLAKKGAQS